jgi:F-type H+-transporting ATPase subunit delta
MIGASQIAQRYARAIHGLANGDAGRAARLLEEFDTLTEEILQSDGLRRCLLTPLYPRAERRAVVSELCNRLGLSAEIRASALILVAENRMGLLAALRDQLRELVDRMAGRVEAQVVSARPLDAPQQERLRQVLAQRVGAQVTLKLREDPSLIGGVVVRLGDLLLDGSVRTQLENLGASLRKGTA